MFLSDLITFNDTFKQKNVFVISLGSLEQHGRFGLIGTDNIIQDELIARVEASLPEVIFVPTVYVGACWQQLGFGGSISLREETLYEMIRDIVDSLKDYSKVLIFVSWHGGNKPVIHNFIESERDKYPSVNLFQITFGDAKTDELAEELLSGPADDHAGNTEIALSLAIRPSATRQPSPNDSKTVVDNFNWDKRVIEINQDGEIDVHPKWVATPEIGQKLITIYANNLTDKIRSILKEA